MDNVGPTNLGSRSKRKQLSFGNLGNAERGAGAGNWERLPASLRPGLAENANRKRPKTRGSEGAHTLFPREFICGSAVAHLSEFRETGEFLFFYD